MSQQDFLKEYYEKKALDFDELKLTYENPSSFKRFFYQSRFNEVMRALDPRKGEKILDLGCGIGYYTREIIKKGSKVTSVEYSEQYLKQAKNLNKKNNSLFIVASATNLPFKSDSFDKVLFTEVIEHIPEYEKAIKEVRRVLKNEGVAVVTTPFKYSPMNIGYYLKRFIRKYGFNEHVHEFTRGELEKLLSKYFSIKNFYMANYVVPYPLDSLFLSIKEDDHGSMRFIRTLDKLFSRTPLLNKLGWTMIFTVQKEDN